jgi:hypothetical protein
MKKRIVVVLAAAGLLGGCVVVPGPYYGETGYYYPAPAVSVGVYGGAGYGHGWHHRGRRW